MSPQHPIYVIQVVCIFFLQGTNEILRLYIALECLKFAGREMLGTTKYVNYLQSAGNLL